MEIYYFSGTGNSLHVSGELAKRFPETRLIPMVRHLHDDSISAASETVGLVFPIHLTAMPYPVKQFVEKLNLDSAEYVFAATTRYGTFHVADLHLRRMLEKKGKSLNAFFVVNMVDNSPCGLMTKSFPGFRKITEGWTDRIAAEKLDEIESSVQEKLKDITATIGSRLPHAEQGSALSAIGKRCASLLMALTEKATRKQVIPFYADDDCTGCGICAEVCLSGRVTMNGNQPEWPAEAPCFFCYACFNSCLEQAILVRDRYERKQGRYLNPAVSPKEIAAQK
jgi:ferredoxin